MGTQCSCSVSKCIQKGISCSARWYQGREPGCNTDGDEEVGMVKCIMEEWVSGRRAGPRTV
eukprot:5033827-Amphidinium_carterae.2